MSHENASVKSILFALLANFGIAITKTVAAVITGSGSMLAESIHSYADCANRDFCSLVCGQQRRNLTMNILDMVKRYISGHSLWP